jgi:predicted amidophosphoribosyltransferase
MRGRPKFYCDHCGAEVPRDAETCPACGRYFQSVRCPSCGFTGKDELFAAGCPSCGYSTPKTASRGTSSERPAPYRPAVVGLPVWVYGLALALLLAVTATAFWRLGR